MALEFESSRDEYSGPQFSVAAEGIIVQGDLVLLTQQPLWNCLMPGIQHSAEELRWNVDRDVTRNS